MLVIGTGATQIRERFTSEQLPFILVAYMKGIKGAFAIGIGMVGGAFLVSFFEPWKKLHGGEKKEVVMAV